MSKGNGHPNPKHGKLRRQTGLSPRVDLTPMVDLAFLLITFFMLTTKLSEQKAMVWEKRVDSIAEPVSECQVMNIMVDSFDRVFVYEGSELENLKISSFEDTHGIRQEIMNKAKRVKAECPLTAKGEKREIICLIKLLPGARYQNMVDILDDMKILEVKTYALQEPLNEEIAAIAQKTKLLLAKR
jgi:biopolymer transport protein ExbD